MARIAFEPPAEISELLAGLDRFLKVEVFKRHDSNSDLLSNPRLAYGEDGRYSTAVRDLMREVRMASSEAGYYTMFVPTALGGGGLSGLPLYYVWERIFHTCGSLNWLGYQAVAHWAKGPSHVLTGLDREVRGSLLPRLLSGEQTMCFAMSEPDAGSDAWQMRTEAERADGGWRLNGTKQWISNGAGADFATVFAVTDRQRADSHRGGVSAFLVPLDSEGVDIEGVIRMFGRPGGDEAIIHFDDTPVDDTHLIGDVHGGFEIALSGVSQGKLYNSAKAVGLARWALEQAIAYASDRVAFGGPISRNQGVSFPLADAAMEVHAAHLLGLNAAQLVERGEAAIQEVSMAKTYSAEVATRAIDRAMQVHGAMGFTSELGLAEAWQAVRSLYIADGSAEMMRRLIASRLLKGEIGL